MHITFVVVLFRAHLVTLDCLESVELMEMMCVILSLLYFIELHNM